MRVRFAILAAVATGVIVAATIAAQTAGTGLRIEADHGRFQVGEPVRLRLSVEAPPGTEVLWPGAGAVLGPFEFLAHEVLPPDTLAADRVRQAADLTVTAFARGEVTLPPQSVTLRLPDGKVVTAVSDSLTLGIESVLPDSAAGLDSLDIRPLKAQVELPGAGRRRLLMALGLLALALLLLIGILAWRRRRRRIMAVAAPPPDPRPADVIALSDLEALRAAGLARAGRLKEHYTRLTDILRPYLERRFGIPAVDSTTSEILAALGGATGRAEAGMRPETMAELEELLGGADLVKFARHRPPAAVAEGEIDRAADFVKTTASRPELAPNAAAGSGVPAGAAVASAEESR